MASPECFLRTAPEGGWICLGGRRRLWTHKTGSFVLFTVEVISVQKPTDNFFHSERFISLFDGRELTAVKFQICFFIRDFNLGKKRSKLRISIYRHSGNRIAIVYGDPINT